MYIVSLTYKVSLEKIEEFLPKHVEYLKKQYSLGNFIASGRKVPRTGGVILSNVSDETKLMEVLDKDPFKQNNLADYDVIEFVPSMVCDELKFLIGE